MNLTVIKNNLTKVETNTATMYFSYRTLIAVRNKKGAYMTEKRYSNTTARHKNIVKSELSEVKYVPQDVLEGMK